VIKRWIFAALGAGALVLSVAAPLPAGASTPTSPKSLAKDLVPPSVAKKAGFTKMLGKVTTSSKTGAPSCPNGAQVVYEDAAGKTGVVAEVLGCTTTKAAAALVRRVRTGTKAISAVPPKRLGPSALERGSGFTYALYWQRGARVELVALNTNVPASTSSSTAPTGTPPPITKAQQRTLSTVALAQNARIP